MNPTLVVLLFSAVSAGAAVLGGGPFLFRRALPIRQIGWANAGAAGMMLGAAYILLIAGLPRGGGGIAAGALLGIAFVTLTHMMSGTEDLDLNRLDDTSPAYGYQVLFVNSLLAKRSNKFASSSVVTFRIFPASSLRSGTWVES